MTSCPAASVSGSYVAMVLCQDTDYADRICAMEDGAVVEHGSPEEILRDDVLTGVFAPVTCIDAPGGRVAVYF